MCGEAYSIDCDEIEDTLGVDVPRVLREFFETIELSGRAYPGLIFRDVEEFVRVNMMLEGEDHWSEENLAFAEDGCGNYFFMLGEEDAMDVFLWAHDPPGIEPQPNAIEFFQRLLRLGANPFG